MKQGKRAAGELGYENKEPPLESSTGEFFVIKGGVTLEKRFESFNAAYMYALNHFASEDFLIWNKNW
ncbi:MAG: hypothetical protein I4N51_24730 [Acinetobacter sp.]|nr:hypothetical protein [Acinetobacter sp.]